MVAETIKDMAKPREVELRGTAADPRREGLDMDKGTRTLSPTHAKAPAVAAMTPASLRLGAFCVGLGLPHRSGCGHTSPLEGVGMT